MSAPRFTLESAGDFLDRKIDTPPVVVDQLIGGGTTTILGGQHKVGKTLLMVQLAMAVATGKQFLWFKTTESPVIYLNLEVADWSFQKRLRRQEVGFLALIDGDRDTRAKLRKNLHVVSLPQFRLDRTGDLNELAIEAGVLGAKLIIVDPIRAAFAGDGNDDRSVNRTMNEILYRVVKPTGAAVVLGAHFRKPPSGEMANGSTWNVKGSGSWSDAADEIVTLSHPRTSGVDRMINSTSRHFEGIDDAKITLRPASLVYAPGPAPRRHVDEKLRAAFTQSITGELSMTDIANVIDVDRTRALRRWNRGDWPQVRKVRTEQSSHRGIYRWIDGDES